MESKPKRPRSVTILVLLQITQAIGLSIYGVYQLRNYGWLLSGGGESLIRYIQLVLLEGMSSAFVSLFLAIIIVAISIALWFLRKWAWMVAMAIQGVGLLAAIILYFQGRPNYIGMALGVLLVFYLNQQEIQEAFASLERRA